MPMTPSMHYIPRYIIAWSSSIYSFLLCYNATRVSNEINHYLIIISVWVHMCVQHRKSVIRWKFFFLTLELWNATAVLVGIECIVLTDSKFCWKFNFFNVLCLGKEFHQSNRLMLIVNRTWLCDLHNPVSAIALLVGSFFILYLAYPAEAGTTLIQRYNR